MNAMQGLKRRAGRPIPVPDDKLPLLDKVHINQLCAVLGSTRVEGLLNILSKELADRPTVIRDAVLAGDVSRARHESHSFKGATTCVGAVALGKVAAAIERAPDLQSMTAWLPALERQAVRTRRAVIGFLPSCSSSVEPD